LATLPEAAPIAEILETVDRASRGLPACRARRRPGARSKWRSTSAHAGAIGRMRRARARTLAMDIDALLEPGAIRACTSPSSSSQRGGSSGYEGLARFEREPPWGPDVWLAAAGEVGRQEQIELGRDKGPIWRASTSWPADAYPGSQRLADDRNVRAAGNPLVRPPDGKAGAGDQASTHPWLTTKRSRFGLADLRARGARLRWTTPARAWPVCATSFS